MMTMVRCQYCEGVIKVSEPLVLLTDGQVPRTVIAGARDTGPAGECYHLPCYSVVARSAGWSVSRH